MSRRLVWLSCTTVAMAVLLVATIARGVPEAATGKGRELTVFAAASLRDAFGKLGESFERTHPGVHVRFNEKQTREVGLGEVAEIGFEQARAADVRIWGSTLP